jgi:hypothetical protein
MAILNLTQHPGTPEQGVTEPTEKEGVRALLTFGGLPSKEEVSARAEALAEMAAAAGADAAMIGGAPYLMALLESALRSRGIKPLYAFSERRSVEFTSPSGEVEKRSVFQHLGFYDAS